MKVESSLNLHGVTVQGAFPAPLVVFSCWQLVVWAICADCAAGVHGSRADSPPHDAHSPSTIYVPVFLLLIVSRLFCPCSCLHWQFLTCPSVPLCGRTDSKEIQQLVWPADTAGRLWNLGFLSSHLNIVYVILCFVARIKFLLLPHSASESLQHPHPDTWDDFRCKFLYTF